MNTIDEIDRGILNLLSENARMTVKEIARRVSLTSPAVSERIRKMEKSGLIAGYGVRLDPWRTSNLIRAIVSIYVAPANRDALNRILQSEDEVEECYQVTGTQSHMVKVACRDIASLEKFISRMQKLGQTNTQIILSTVRGPSGTGSL